MGFFGKLFDKKECSICGGEIGLLGNRKLEDGNMCKECAKKLSPWFDDRRHSTVEQINQQLAYREENQRNLATFRPTKTYGESYELHVEFSNGAPSRFVVAQTSDYMGENADLLAFKDVNSFNIDIDENKRELKRQNSNGESVSYVPPRYEYSYDFRAEIHTNNPYCDDISFRLNRDTLNLETVDGPQNRMGMGQFTIKNRTFNPSLFPEYRHYQTLCEELEELFQAGMQGIALNGYAAAANTQDLAQVLLAKIPNAKMEELDALLKEASDITILNRPDYKEIQAKIIKAVSDRALELHAMRIGNQTAAAAAPQASAGPKFCPNCGAPADGGKFCQSCGAPF